jgi:hypothetical protein
MPVLPSVSFSPSAQIPSLGRRLAVTDPNFRATGEEAQRTLTACKTGARPCQTAV